jgi:hypothetical protein
LERKGIKKKRIWWVSSWDTGSILDGEWSCGEKQKENRKETFKTED